MTYRALGWVRWLYELGDSPAEVYRSMVLREIHGHRRSPGLCPVALAAKQGGMRDAQVTPDFLAGTWVVVDLLGLGNPYDRQSSVVYHTVPHRLTVPLPLPVRQFVESFDRGDYPDLVLPPGFRWGHQQKEE
jgi:hypothetical protein